MAEERESFEGWALLEIMGHRRIAGRVSEQTVAGAPMVRVDVPANDELGRAAATQFYSTASLFCVTPMTEADVRRLADLISTPSPVSVWEQRQLGPAPEVEDHERAYYAGEGSGSDDDDDSAYRDDDDDQVEESMAWSPDEGTDPR